mmetsp:Transcript_37439/g.85806  ORF Transcript_37439/g.85806 Transcript_37439/m.85806 type:complete len:1060 (+) Transcript_37439:289-3468(+)
MPSQQVIFTDDLVQHQDHQGRLHEIGIVERAPNSSDEESEDEDAIVDDDDDRGGKLPPGSAKVRWSKQESLRTELTSNLALLDRVFLLGDIVARASNQLGQTGIVVGMRMLCNCRRHDGTEFRRVPTEMLQPLAACRPGALVVHQQAHWLGRVDEVFDNVQIQFEDGAVCKVLRTNANSLSVHSPTMDEQTWFWPSMIVSGTREILRRAKWIKGSFRSSYVGKEATVVKVQAAQALVRWLAAAPSEMAIEPPAEMQRPSRLIELHQHHARLCWRLGEHAWLKPEDMAQLQVEAADEPLEMTHKKQKERKKAGALASCVEITSCHTRVDVIWQDGTRETDTPATLLAPAKHVDGYYEFWPQDFIVGTASREAADPLAPVGVVQSVNHDQRICVVTWREDGKREVVPVYEIAPHPDFNFKVGDIVLRLPKAHNYSEPPNGAQGEEPGEARPARHGDVVMGDAGGASPVAPTAVDESVPVAAPADGLAAEAAEDEEGAPGDAAGSSRVLAYIGEVRSIGSELTVRWMDGTTGTVPPEELYVVNTEEEEEPVEEPPDESFDEEDESFDSHGPAHTASHAGGDALAEGGESSGWETVSSDDEGVGNGGANEEAAGGAEGEAGEAENGEDDEVPGDVKSTPSVAAAAESQAASLASQLRHDSQSSMAVPEGETTHLCAGQGAATAEGQREEMSVDDNAYASAEELGDASENEPSAVGRVAPPSRLQGNAAQSDSEAAVAEFDQMDKFWVEDCDSEWHHFRQQSSATPYGTAFTRVAQKQWKLLQAGLPKGIYCCAFSDRVDLLRALIVGPPGTPYEDAVFVFDLQLPPEFPHQPPAVHYVSHGERINPNLYENGKVCLSLLGTWTGRQSCELWDPSQSTVLQVLISIQALVLCEMPYFNEAGYEKQLGTEEGAHHARRYNEGALLLSLKSMMTTLANLPPPSSFERLTKLHFTLVRERILRRCKLLCTLKDSAAAALLPPETDAAAAVAPAASAAPSAESTRAEREQTGAASSANTSSHASAPSAVCDAGLSGVLNDLPSLGFLHSLQRMLPNLEAAFNRCLVDS